jgi:hypothetical protein
VLRPSSSVVTTDPRVEINLEDRGDILNVIKLAIGRAKCFWAKGDGPHSSPVEGLWDVTEAWYEVVYKSIHIRFSIV